MTKLSCIIVDDESLARKLLEESISHLPFLSLVGICKNPFEAMEVLQQQTVDLMFLDIQMPGMLGTKFLQSLREKPMVIFVTAYSNYAVESYELNVIDYLMKPVSMERFTTAALKAQEAKQMQDALKATASVEVKSNQDEAFFVNVEYALVKVMIKDISHVESMKDYVKIYLSTTPKPIITKSTLKAIEEKLPASTFMRIHKSFIINLNKIESIRSQTITIGQHAIPVSDGYVEALMKVVNGMK
jgi:DNA-binding LytR/AlgR family response regulator